MTNPWLSILAELPLSRTERAVVKRFEQDPKGRSFLPVADILRAHRLVEEGLELLVQGVARHPGFSVARVVLARELLQEGRVGEAWRTLEDAPEPLRDNVLAQKLRFKMAVLLGASNLASATLDHMRFHQMLDDDIRALAEAMDRGGFAALRARLVDDLAASGIRLVLAERVMDDFLGEDGEDEKLSDLKKQPPATLEPQIALVAEDSALSSSGGFHVVPLEEIFRSGGWGEGEGRREGTVGGGGVELDSTTLADIYASQTHYGKALSVYRRLLKMSPNNERLKRKVAELTKLDREQRDVDLTVDPSLVDRMETIEIIDRQIKFYSDLLGRLS